MALDFATDCRPMSRIVISSSVDAERLAKSFSDLISPKRGLQANQAAGRQTTDRQLSLRKATTRDNWAWL